MGLSSRTLFSGHLPRPVDTVEVNYFNKIWQQVLVGTYQLDEATGQRTGSLHMLTYKPATEKLDIDSRAVECAAVLDSVWLDGKTAAIALSDGTVGLAHLVGDDLSLGEVSHFAAVGDGLTTAVAASPRHIAACATDGSVKVFDKVTAAEVEGVPQHEVEVWTVALLNDALFTGDDFGRLRVTDLRTGTVITQQKLDAGVCSFAFHPTSRQHFYSGGYDDELKLWDLRDMRGPLFMTDTKGGPWRLRWCPAQCHLLAAVCYDHFQLFRIEQLQPLLETVYQGPHDSIAYGASWLPGDDTNSHVAVCGSFYDRRVSVVSFDEEINTCEVTPA